MWSDKPAPSEKAPFVRTLGVLLLAALATTAGAEVLVTRDGATLETVGPWEVRGAMVVFTGAKGVLSSIRLDEVDLGASEAEATRREEAEAAREAALSVSVPKQPVLVLTDADIPRAAVATVHDEEQPRTAPGGAASTHVLELIEWEEIRSVLGGLEIRGRVGNTRDALVRNVRIDVVLSNAAGVETARTRAFVSSAVLEPRGDASFRALFPDETLLLGEPRFELAADAAAWDTAGVDRDPDLDRAPRDGIH